MKRREIYFPSQKIIIRLKEILSALESGSLIPIEWKINWTGGIGSIEIKWICTPGKMKTAMMPANDSEADEIDLNTIVGQLLTEDGVQDAPQATIAAPAGVDYRLEPIGWQTGLRVDPADVLCQDVINKQDFVRIYCPFDCGGSDVHDKAVFTLRKVLKCRQCKRSFEVKRMDDVHLWKAIDNEETTT